MSDRDPLDNVVLTVEAINGLEFAAARRDRRPLSTTEVLLGLFSADSVGAWEGIQLRTSYLDADDGIRFPDPRPDPSGEWHGVPLTASCMAALDAAVAIAADYHLVPLPPAVLALGLLADPEAGASRALLDSGTVDHAELLAFVQSEVLDVTLEGFDPKQALRLHEHERSSRLRRLIGRPATGPPEAVRTTDWVQEQPSALAALALALDDATLEGFKPLLSSMLLEPDSIRQLDGNLRTIEDQPAAMVRETARRRFDMDVPDAGACIVAVALSGSARVEEALRRLAVTPREVAGAVAEYRLRVQGNTDSSERVFRATILSALLTTVTSVLLIRAALQGDHWWKLAFLFLVWTGYPQTGPVGSTAVAAIFLVAVSPLVALSQLVSIGSDLIQARAERRTLLARAGVRLSLAETRSVKLRLLNTRGRQLRFLLQRQRARFRGFREGRHDPLA